MKENLPAKEQERYSPSLTQQVRTETVQQTFSAHADILKAPKRVDLHDMNAVVTAAENYIERCQQIGKPPSVEGLIGSLGMSRANYYKYLSKHPEDPVVQYLQYMKNSINAVRISLADQGIISPVSLIFLLKNCYENYADRVELTPGEPNNLLADMDPEAARKRIADAIPIDDYDESGDVL